MKRKIFLLTATLLITSLSLATTVSNILIKMDELQTIKDDVTAKVDMVQQDAEQGPKKMSAIFFGRDREDQFMIVMTAPEAEKGNGYLKVDKNFWMYRRNTRTFQHINRDESIAGTDANAGDFEASNYMEQYEGVKDKSGQEKIIKEKLGKLDVFKVELVAKIPDVDYPKKILWVRQDNYLPLKEQSFSLSGALMYTNYFLKYSKINGRFIVMKQLVIDEFEKGNKTLWEIREISFDPIKDNIFTKGYLENLSK